MPPPRSVCAEPVTSPDVRRSRTATAGRDGRRCRTSTCTVRRGVTVEELADLDAYLDEDAMVFVEWPEAGAGMLPAADRPDR